MVVGCRKDLDYLIFSFVTKNRNNSLELQQPLKNIHKRNSKLYTVYIITIIFISDLKVRAIFVTYKFYLLYKGKMTVK